MAVQYAKTYIDRAVDFGDLPALYNVVRALGVERDLAEPLRLFVRLWDWAGATRSGVWQYYENVRIADFTETAAMLERCSLTEIATRYSAGMECWEKPHYCEDLDAWIRTNEPLIEDTAMRLIGPHRKQLYAATH